MTKTVTTDKKGVETTTYTTETGDYVNPETTTTPQGGVVRGSGFLPPADSNSPDQSELRPRKNIQVVKTQTRNTPTLPSMNEDAPKAPSPVLADASAVPTPAPPAADITSNLQPAAPAPAPPAPAAAPLGGAIATPTPAPQEDISRKLIRNATLEIEVLNYVETSDKITAMARDNGGYVDTANSDRGGNGKLEGTIVVKVKPEKLDDFLLALRAIGDVKNQSIATEDVTKDYYDIQARLVNASKTEEQLQELLARNNGKVAELLAVERELDRVRGQIESMQGEIKLYDFQVQFATVTITIQEKDLHQAARYLLKETDTLTLNTNDVEGTYQEARHAVEDNKGQLLQAEVNRTSNDQIYAKIDASIPPDRIESFLDTLKALGRVEGLQRQSQRVAQDGADANAPADSTVTDKDNVEVSITIALDTGAQQQVNLTLVTKTVETAYDHIKEMVDENKGIVLSSQLTRDQNGSAVAILSIRVPGSAYQTMIDYFRSVGRVPNFVRNNRADTGGQPAANSPVVMTISMTDDETPVQTTETTVVTDTVLDKVNEVKAALGKFDAELKSSTFEQQTDGRAEANLVIKLPLKQYAQLDEVIKGLGRVESSSIHRDEHPIPAEASVDKSAQFSPEETAPAEIHLRLHSQPDLVPPENGVGSTIRNTFTQSTAVLGSSLTLVVVLFVAVLPWALAGAVLLWAARRLYLWLKK
jgi:hypothetical protein